MKNLTFIIALSISSLVHAELADGIYAISGQNSIRGAYTGKLQVTGDKLIRLIHFNDLNLETVWEGKQIGDQAQFILAPTSVLTSFNNFTVPDEELQSPLNVVINLASEKTEFLAGRDGVYAENYSRIGDNTGIPLWINLRTNLNARNDASQLTVKIMRALGIDMVIDWYRNQTAVEVPLLAQRPEFLNQQQWQIFDPTDSDFYRQNPDVLRVANKTLNPLSIAEATMRRNAYAPTLNQKAKYFDAQTTGLNLNEAGLLELAQVDENGQKIHGYIEGDSCLWTGMYLWSQVMRYEVTHEVQALQNIKKAVNGLLTLIDITGDPTEFARTLLISPATENMGPLYIQGKGAYSHLKWIANGNNDMSKGLLVGLASVYKVLKQEDPQLFSRVELATKKLIGLKGISEKSYNLGMAYGLLALYSDKIEIKAIQKFKSGVDNLMTTLSAELGVDSGIHWKAVVDMSGNHLSVATTLGILLITKNFEEKFSKLILNGFDIKGITKHYNKVLKNSDLDHRIGHRGYETIAAYGMTHDPALREDARNALWCLREIPAPRSIGDAVVDMKRLPNWSPSAWPVTPWKGMEGVNKLKPNLNYAQFEQGAFGYPIFEAMSWQTTYFWKENSYAVKYQGSSKIVPFSSDYLVMYWLSRSAGLVTAEE